MGTRTKVLIPFLLDTDSAATLVEQVVGMGALLKKVGPEDIMFDGLVPMTERVFLHSEEAPRRALLAQAKGNPRLADLLIDRVFPRVAAQLESAWNDDRMSFVDVTIAATRLQDAIRSLGRFVLPRRDLPSLLMIVPAWEQHGLPAAFAADRFRRMGAPTGLLTGLDTPALGQMIGRIDPSALMISIGSYRSMARVGELISDLRRQTNRSIPVVVGGPALAMETSAMRNCKADLMTNDLTDALRFCDFIPCE